MNPRAIALSASCMLAFGLCASRAVPAAQPQAVPAQQQAIVQVAVGGPATLKLQKIPVPQPAEGQVLIRVYAASVNPADWGQLARPAAEGEAVQRVPGLDVSGVIAAVGPGVTDRSVGMPVFGMVDRTGLNGGYEHYTLARAASTAPKPANVSYAEAAGLGVVGVTALGALDEAQVHAGQTVLITGVAGGVGSVAAQIAVARGARVLGTASARHAAYLRRIGVSKVIDYTKGNITAQAGPVDAVIDTVGGAEALDAFHALKAGGRFVTIVRAHITPEECETAKVHCLGSPGPAARAPTALLLQLAQLAHDRNLRLHVDRRYPLAQAAKALQYMHQGHTEGKVILAVTAAGR